MKFRGFLIGCLTLGFATSSIAQVEYDDMYFNASDRSALNALKASNGLAMTSKKKSMLEEDISQNPTDSYSARNINPEHVSRSNAKAAQEDEQDYFISNYQHNTASGYNNWNNSFNNWYSNPWYSSGWYSSAFSAWNSPYYSPYYSYYGSPYTHYDNWSSPWYDPFYGSMNGAGSYWGGSSWSVGLNYGFGGMYGGPFSMRPWGWVGSGYGWYQNWYPRTTVVIVDNNGGQNGISYGKRPVRGSKDYTSGSTTTPARTRDNVSLPTYGRSDSGGRTITTSAPSSTQPTSQAAYYNKNWRSASQGSSTRGTNYRSSWSGSDSNTGSSGYNSGRSYRSSSSDAGRSSAPTYTPSRSSGSSSYSGGNSSGSRSTGTGSSGRSRGRD